MTVLNEINGYVKYVYEYQQDKHWSPVMVLGRSHMYDKIKCKQLETVAKERNVALQTCREVVFYRRGSRVLQ